MLRNTRTRCPRSSARLRRETLAGGRMRGWLIATALFVAVGVAAAPALAQTAEPQFSSAEGLTDGQEFDDCGGADWCPRMIVVPGGSLLIGSPASEPGRDGNEGPQRSVHVERFSVGRYEITFAEWDACAADGGCKSNPQPSDSGWGRGRRPVNERLAGTMLRNTSLGCPAALAIATVC